MKILIFAFASLLSMSISDCGTKVSTEPCFTDREVTASLENIDLKCLNTGDLNILVNEADQSRYSVCNSEAHVMEEGKSYVVSGKVYKVKPNERWPGTPFEITSAKKK